MRLRRKGGPDPPQVLGWKVGIFFLAAGVWITGVIIGEPWLTGVAIVLLGIGMLLRLFSRDRELEDEEEEEEEED